MYTKYHNFFNTVSYIMEEKKKNKIRAPNISIVFPFDAKLEVCSTKLTSSPPPPSLLLPPYTYTAVTIFFSFLLCSFLMRNLIGKSKGTTKYKKERKKMVPLHTRCNMLFC